MKLKLVFRENRFEDIKYHAWIKDEDRHDYDISSHGTSNFLFYFSGDGNTKEEALNNLKANINFFSDFINNYNLQSSD